SGEHAAVPPITEMDVRPSVPRPHRQAPKGARRRPRRLADRLCPRPRILFVGINPSLRSAEVGHHFAGPGNPFWRLLVAARLAPKPLGYADEVPLPELGLAPPELLPAATPPA